MDLESPLFGEERKSLPTFKMTAFDRDMGLAGRWPAFFDELLGEISNLSGCFSAENNGTAAGVAGRSGLVGVHEEGALTRLKAVRRNRC
jgi:hypothetical protein